MTEQQLLVDCLARLNAAGIDYMLTGSMASNWNQRTSSERQLRDAAGVCAVQRERLDVPYLRQWAARLQVGDVLEDILAGRVSPKST